MKTLTDNEYLAIYAKCQMAAAKMTAIPACDREDFAHDVFVRAISRATAPTAPRPYTADCITQVVQSSLRDELEHRQSKKEVLLRQMERLDPTAINLTDCERYVKNLIWGLDASDEATTAARVRFRAKRVEQLKELLTPKECDFVDALLETVDREEIRARLKVSEIRYRHIFNQVFQKVMSLQ